MAVTAATAIPLRQAYAKFSKKRLGYKAVRRNGSKASVHLLPNAAVLVRVSEDEVVVTDGSWGYTPFKLSGLEQIIREAKKLPIRSEFNVNSVRG